MLALGLLLFVASGVVALGVVLDNTDAMTASAFGVTVDNVSIGGFFLAGAVVGVVFVLGLGMVLAGLKRRRRTRKDVKLTRRDKLRLEKENAELRAGQSSEPSAMDTSADAGATRKL
jgi:hypothetical protein